MKISNIWNIIHFAIRNPAALVVGGMLYNNKRSNDLPIKSASYKNSDNIQYP